MIDPARHLDRLIAWAPLLLLGGLAALTWWLDAQITENGARRGGEDRHDPSLIIEGVRAIELDEKGNAVQTLAARRASHYPDDGTVEFEAPHFTMSPPGQPRFSVQALRGRMSGDRENAYFEGDVKATRAAEPGAGAAPTGEAAGPISLSTEFLHVIPRQDRAQTDRPVTIEEPRGIIRATGLVLDNAAKTLHLNTDVRGTLVPQETR